MGVANALPATTALTLANAAGAALNLNGNAQTIGSLSGGGPYGGNVNLRRRRPDRRQFHQHNLLRRDRRHGHRRADQASAGTLLAHHVADLQRPDDHRRRYASA